eukprot:GILI01008510.1.p1 GENE.GILI01008510.1~~GILI01008510.1.p1  ORF type:complete len:214 (+),score=75.86 GILI01008510.1:51-644(+)
MWNSVPGKRILAEKLEQDALAKHMQKINSVKPSVDNNNPAASRPMRMNGKRAQLEQERCAAIQRDNKILLQKMLAIDLKPPSIAVPSSPPKKSLHKSARTKELAKITLENKQMLKRLQSIQPVYNSAKWEEEARQRESLVKNICSNSGHTRRTRSQSALSTVYAASSSSAQMLESMDLNKEELADLTRHYTGRTSSS